MKLSSSTDKTILPWLLSTGLLLFTHPLLANKFETIGGGVQGSTRLKIEYMQWIAYAASAIFLVAGVLTILLHNKNALTLNYTMWKSSATLFFLLSISAFTAAVIMH
jgi:uncharacterized integral membrane protein